VHAASAEALVDGVVFAIDGKERLSLTAGFCGNELSGSDQAFFVGEAYGFAGADGFVCSLKASNADDGADHEIDVGMGGYTDGSSGAVKDFDIGDSGFIEARSKVICVGLSADGNYAGTPTLGLLEGQFKIPSSSQRDHLKAVGKRFNHTKTAAADASGRSQDRDEFHG